MGDYSLKLMIVDNKPSEREGVKSIVDWNSIGIEITGEAVNGQDGIEKARKLKPDIIITDIVMPQADGFKMVEEIRRFLPDVKVIVMSCFDNFNFAKSAININAAGYVLKPIIAGELLETISKVTGIHIREIERKKEEEELIRRLRQYLPALREQLHRDILYGILKNEDEIWERNEFLEAGLFRGSFIVLVAEIEEYDLRIAGFSEEKKQIYTLKLKEFFVKACRDIGKSFSANIVDIDRSRYALLVNSNSQPDCFKSAIQEFSEQLKDEAQKDFQLELTVGISGCAASVVNVDRCYQEACDALRFKSFLGRSQTFNYSDMYGSTDALKNFSASLAHNDIRYLVMTGDRKEIERFVDRMFNECIKESGGLYAQYLCSSVVSFLQIMLLEAEETLGNIFGNERMILEKLFRFETIKDARQWLKNIIWSVSTHISSKSNTKNKRVVTIMKDYIDRSFSADLSVAGIAEQVYMSPCYANFIFKKETGDTLNEYLTKVRIEEAKKLLKNSLLKVYEISHKVGYKNNTYFNLVFKEHCGLTPLEYRDA